MMFVMFKEQFSTYAALYAEHVLSSHVFQMARSPLFPVSVFIIRAKQYLNRTGSKEDVTERLFGVSSHSLTPVDSHS